MQPRAPAGALVSRFHLVNPALHDTDFRAGVQNCLAITLLSFPSQQNKGVSRRGAKQQRHTRSSWFSSSWTVSIDHGIQLILQERMSERCACVDDEGQCWPRIYRCGYTVLRRAVSQGARLRSLWTFPGVPCGQSMRSCRRRCGRPKDAERNAAKRDPGEDQLYQTLLFNTKPDTTWAQTQQPGSDLDQSSHIHDVGGSNIVFRRPDGPADSSFSRAHRHTRVCKSP